MRQCSVRRFGRAAIVAVTSLGLLGCTTIAPTGRDLPAISAEPSPANLRTDAIPPDAQPAVVASIIDGDTIRVHIGDIDEIVRLLEIDAPEASGGCGAMQATGAVGDLVPPGSTVWLERDVEDRDRYGRLLRYVWRDDAALLNERLIEAGWAEAKLFLPNDRRWAAMRRAQQVARDAGAGIWRLCASRKRGR